MKVLVVDIDNTLILTPKISRFFWLLSSLFQLIARRLQYANVKLVKQFGDYDKVIILTGRGSADSEYTRRQLELLQIPFQELVFCPLTNVVGDWKLSVVRELTKTSRGKIWWIDDELGKSIPTKGLRRFGVEPLMNHNAY